MSVVLALEQLGPCRKQVKVAIPAPAVEAETRRVTQEYRRRAKIPGFRRGKVPEDLIRRRYGEEIDREVVDRLVPRYWRQAEAEKQLAPLLAPKVEDVERSADAGLTFVAVVETRPEIELGDLGGFELPDPPIEPSEEEVDQALAGLQRSAADWVPVERPAAVGDRVTAHLYELAAAGERGEGQAVTVELGDADVWEELTGALTGLTAGEEVEFTRAAAGEGAGERHFAAEVAAVKERDLPPLDDAFAARLGDFADLAALRAEVARRVRREKSAARESQRERALLDQLRERHPVPLPEGVVEQEIEELLRDYAQGLASRGVDLDRAEIDWQRLAGEVRPQAERRVHARLLLDEAARRMEIAVPEEELQATLAGLGRAQGRSAAVVRRSLEASGRLGELREQLVRRRTVRRLLGEEGAAPDAESLGTVSGASSPDSTDDAETP